MVMAILELSIDDEIINLVQVMVVARRDGPSGRDPRSHGGVQGTVAAYCITFTLYGYGSYFLMLLVARITLTHVFPGGPEPEEDEPRRRRVQRRCRTFSVSGFSFQELWVNHDRGNGLFLLNEW